MKYNKYWMGERRLIPGDKKISEIMLKKLINETAKILWDELGTEIKQHWEECEGTCPTDEEVKEYFHGIARNLSVKKLEIISKGIKQRRENQNRKVKNRRSI